MQNYCKTIGAMAAASALVAGTASAEVEYEIHAGYTSEYIFRGIDLGDHLTEVGLNATTEYNGVGLSAGIWAAAFDSSFNTGNQVDNEVDTYVEASYDFGFLTGAIGYIYYWNMGSLGADNQEIYFSASRDFGWASASLTYYWDIDDASGGDTDGYTELALSRSWELNQCVTLNVGTNLGYLTEGGEFTAWTTKASLDWGFVDRAKLSPFVAFALALGESSNTNWAQTDNEFVGGCILSVGF